MFFHLKKPLQDSNIYSKNLSSPLEKHPVWHHCAPTIGIMTQIVPDNKITRAKFCQNLASLGAQKTSRGIFHLQLGYLLMKSLHKLFIATALVVAGAVSLQSNWLATPVSAQEKVEENKVLAIINGHKITTKEVKLAADDILPNLVNVPPKLRYPFIIEYLIERRLLAQEAIRAGLGNDNEYKTRIVFYQAKALRDAYFEKKLKASITDEMVRKKYEEQAALVKPVERFRARHILVATEQEAKDIAAKLKKGEKFEALAKKFSIDGSKDFGGDLGYFTADEMVAEFAAATKSLKKGEVSGPVKTEFGWHIINLLDRQDGGPRPYEEVKPAIQLVLLRQAVQKKVDDLRKQSKIEMIDPGLKEMLKQARKQRDAIEAQQKKSKAKKPAAN